MLDFRFIAIGEGEHLNDPGLALAANTCRQNLQCLHVDGDRAEVSGRNKIDEPIRIAGAKGNRHFLIAVSPASSAQKSSFVLETRTGTGYYTSSDLLFQNKHAKPTRFIVIVSGVLQERGDRDTS